VTTVLPVSWTGKMVVTPLHGTGSSSGMTFDVWDGGATYEYYLNCDAVSPTIVLSANTCKVSFDYRVTAWVSTGYPGAAIVFTPTDKIEVQVSTNGGLSWTVIYTIDQSNHVTSQNFANKSVLLTGYVGPIKIRLYSEGHVGCDQFVDIDNFVVEEGPLCAAPTGLTATGITINSANIGWTGPSVVILDYGTPGHTAGTGTIINPVSTNPYTLSGLAPGATYDVYLRQECSPGVFSPWAGPVTVNTLPILQITPNPFNFGYAASGGQSASQSFAIKNNGTTGLLIDQIDLTGTNYDQFELTGGTVNYTLGAGATYTVSIVFKPTSSGLKSANLRVSENETDHLCPISGTGLCAATVAPFTEDFEGTTFPPACWNRSTDTQMWNRTTACSGYGVGTASAYAYFYNFGLTTPFDLMTLNFNATGLNNPVLKFDYAYATYAGEVDELDLYYSTNNGNTWTLLEAMPGGTSGILNTGGSVGTTVFIPTAGQWATHTKALPAGTNMIKFQAISAYGNNLYVDNVKVEAGLPTNYSATGTYNDGLTHCFNASNTITVSGFTATGTGTNIEFIAGQKVSFTPPVLVGQSAHMWAHITTTSSYCTSSDAPMVAALKQEEPVNTIEQPWFSLFPNPTSGNITVVQKSGTPTGTFSVEIYSMRGEPILQALMIGEKQHEFNTSALPTGLYFVKLTGSDFTQTIKLVKTR
jgi:hypothetical protein